MSDTNFKYEIRDDGLAYWTGLLIHPALGLSTIAICYDATDGTPLIHGKPDVVNKYAIKIRQAFTNSGDQNILSPRDISVVEIPVNPYTIEQINRMISASGVVNAVLAKIVRELAIR